MSDKDITEAQNEAETTATTESPAEETNRQPDAEAAEVTQSQEETQEQSAETKGEQPEKKDGKRDRTAEGRIKELTAKLKSNEQANISQQLQAATPQQQRQFADYLEGRDDVTPSELNQIANQWLAENQQRLTQQTDAQVNLRIQQYEARRTLESDINELSGNETLKENPELENHVVDLWMKAANAQVDKDGNVVSFNPQVRLADIAKQEIELIEKHTNRGRAHDAAALSQQAEETAVTPSAKTKPDKTATEKSIAELRKELGYHEE